MVISRPIVPRGRPKARAPIVPPDSSLVCPDHRTQPPVHNTVKGRSFDPTPHPYLGVGPLDPLPPVQPGKTLVRGIVPEGLGSVPSVPPVHTKDGDEVVDSSGTGRCDLEKGQEFTLDEEEGKSRSCTNGEGVLVRGVGGVPPPTRRNHMV